MKTSYLFAAKWANGDYEIIISDNGEAERRHALATGIGGPNLISYGPITKRHTDTNVRAYFGKRFILTPQTLIIQYFGTAPLLRKETDRKLFLNGVARSMRGAA